MRQVRAHTAQQVKDQIAKVPQSVFNIVAKNAQKPHIANYVPPISMEEHGADERNKGDACRYRSTYPPCEIAGNEGELVFKALHEARALDPFIEKDEQVQHDQKIIDERRG